MTEGIQPDPNAVSREQADAPFCQLLTGAQSSLFAFISGLLGGAADASDVLQETNLVLWGKSDEFDRSREFLPWALKFAHMQVLAYRKRQQRNRIVFDDSLVDTLATEFGRDVSSKLGRSRLAALDECISKLPRAHRELIAKFYVQGTTLRKLAEVVGKRANTVAACLYRVRKRLADCVELKLRSEGAA